jgi:hypothetical protein
MSKPKWKWKPVSLVLLSLVFVSSGCDERCSNSNCRVLVEECGFVLDAEPNFALCGVRPDDAPKDRHEYCPAACVASNSGEALECIGESSNACEDDPVSVVRRCTSDQKEAEAACVMKCATQRTTCEQKCSRDAGGVRECMDCAVRCGLALGRCETACPRAGS